MDRANAGDETVRCELRDHFRNDPIGVEVVASAGAPQSQALILAVQNYTGGGILADEITDASLDALRRELCGPDPTPLERMLADRVVICWFAVGALECRIAKPPAGGRLIPQADFLERQLTHATRRFLASVRSLAVVRKLSAPSVLATTRSVSVRVETSGRAGARQDDAIGAPADVLRAIGASATGATTNRGVIEPCRRTTSTA